MHQPKAFMQYLNPQKKHIQCKEPSRLKPFPNPDPLNPITFGKYRKQPGTSLQHHRLLEKKKETH